MALNFHSSIPKDFETRAEAGARREAKIRFFIKAVTTNDG